MRPAGQVYDPDVTVNIPQLYPPHVSSTHRGRVGPGFVPTSAISGNGQSSASEGETKFEIFVHEGVVYT
jgi:hypothetical protein